MRNRKGLLSTEQQIEIISLLKSRFAKNTNRHTNLEWAEVQSKLEVNPDKLWCLEEETQAPAQCDGYGLRHGY